jgi:subfamily B ATP-binding cassette protein MsbA
VKNYLALIRISMRRWPHYIITLITMLGYAFFSAASIPLFIPMMDDILNREFKESYAIESLSEFYEAFVIALGDMQRISLSELTGGSSGGPIDALFKQTDPMVLLIAVVILMTAFTVLKQLFFIVNRYSVLNIEGRTTRDVKTMLFERYINFPFAFFDKHKVGDALVRLSSDIRLVSEKLVAVVLNNIRDALMLFAYLGYAIYLNANLFLNIIIFIPPLLAVTSLIGKKMKKYTTRLQEQLELLFNKLEEVFRGLKIVRAFARVEREQEKFSHIAEEEFRLWYRRSMYDMLNHPLGEVVGLGIAVSILWFGGIAVIEPTNDFSFGEFIAFLSAILLTLNPMKATLKNYSDIRKAAVSMHRIFAILNQREALPEREQAVAIDTFTEAIEFKDVTFRYNEAEKPVLERINLRIAKGEKVAFVGATGSGKTTLINLLPRFYDIESGTLTIDATDIKDFRIASLRKLFGYVTQDSFLFNDSIANNVAYGAEKTDMERVITACQTANASEFVEKLPQGYETVIANYGANFSGGQRQRLCIARAIYNDPDILIFDEATSALDSEAENKVQEAITRATANKTLAVVAHRLSTILNSDKIVVLRDGKIDAVGSHDELLRDNKEYSKLYHLQFAGAKK